MQLRASRLGAPCASRPRQHLGLLMCLHNELVAPEQEKGKKGTAKKKLKKKGKALYLFFFSLKPRGKKKQSNSKHNESQNIRAVMR